MRKTSAREGFSLIELLVTIAIGAVLLGLLLPAVQKVREIAAVVKCKNNLKQIGIAFHSFDASTGAMPPGLGYVGPNCYGSGFLHALPDLEQDNLYKQASVNGFVWAGFSEVRGQEIKLLLCPSDPTTGDRVVDNNGVVWGPSSYAGNAQVFCETDPVTGEFLGINKRPSLGKSFPDGTSTTILFAEKYSRCQNISFRYGGSRWAYDVIGTGALPLHAAFSVSWTTVSVGPKTYFLVRPDPGKCDPSLASTPHASINVTMADGSVRSLSPGLTPGLWWALQTPAGGETVTLPE
jgi:prepilin-type N-terminal cleavage/methylation domain-containing protein